MVSSALTRSQLNTVDEEKIAIFERDPCALYDVTPLIDESEEGHLDQPFIWYGEEAWTFGSQNVMLKRGNCSVPNVCTCLCKIQYNKLLCDTKGGDDAKAAKYCHGAFQDELSASRNLLQTDEVFGTRDCREGYEGVVDSYDRFTSCHLSIKVPSGVIDESPIVVIVILGGIVVMSAFAYFYLKEKVKKLAMQAKIDRRKSRRSSEESITK